MNEEYFTIQEAADKLRVTSAAIRKWIAQGKINPVYVGADRRITGTEILRFVKSSTETRNARHSADDVQSEGIQMPGLVAAPSLG